MNHTKNNTKADKKMAKNVNNIESSVRKKSVVDVEVEEEYLGKTITQPFSPSDIRLTTPPMNLGDLIEMIQAGWINFETEYHREGNLWNNTQQSRLIESILLGLRLPAFYFEEVSIRKWNIIDGMQRCCAINNFFVEQNLSLNNLEFLGGRYNGKKFRDFDFPTRREIRMLPITVNILSRGVPDMVKYVLFNRLNTGGLTTNRQEIRNALFHGTATEIIKEMANCNEFLIVTQMKISRRRQLDMDYVSHFVAFYIQGWRQYIPDMETYIDKSLEVLNNKFAESDCNKMIRDFKKSMILAEKLFGQGTSLEKRMKNKGQTLLNKSFFEVISVLLSKLSDEECDLLEIRKDLLNQNVDLTMNYNQKYRNSFSQHVGNRTSVMVRFSYTELIIENTLKNKKIYFKNDKEITFKEL